MRVLSSLFRCLFLDGLAEAHGRGEIELFGDLAGLAEPASFRAHLATQRRREWVVYAKAPFAGPKQVLAYLARYTHRVAIANSRLVALDDDGLVSFRWKDYRSGSGRQKPKIMRLPAGEFMRRFLLLHALPDGFHRIRHYGLFANGHRAAMIARCRELQLHALAYNLANFLHSLALPQEVEQWSLTTLREKLVKIGARIVRHGRYVVFQLAEVAVPRVLFEKILRLIADLRPRSPPLPA